MTFTVSEDQTAAMLTDGARTLRFLAKISLKCGDCALRKFCTELGRATCCSAFSRRSGRFIIWEEVT